MAKEATAKSRKPATETSHTTVTKKAPKAKKAPKRKRTSGPPITVANHRFAPGTTVSFHRVFEIGVERSEGRAPVPTPVKTAKVKANGTLEVTGLSKGSWCAAGPSGETFRYLQFEVK